MPRCPGRLTATVGIMTDLNVLMGFYKGLSGERNGRGALCLYVDELSITRRKLTKSALNIIVHMTLSLSLSHTHTHTHTHTHLHTHAQLPTYYTFTRTLSENELIVMFFNCVVILQIVMI